MELAEDEQIFAQFIIWVKVPVSGVGRNVAIQTFHQVGCDIYPGIFPSWDIKERGSEMLFSVKE